MRTMCTALSLLLILLLGNGGQAYRNSTVEDNNGTLLEQTTQGNTAGSLTNGTAKESNKNDPYCDYFSQICHVHKHNWTHLHCYDMIIDIICWEKFNHSMYSLDKGSWCTWNNVSSLYSNFTLCTERMADCLGIPWPNKLIEDYFVHLHSKYFKYCDFFNVYRDPPEKIVLALILTPISIIPLMVAVVVWKTKNGKPSS
ncbi:receptor activity-modifying protein 2 isoform X1 [Acipenser ruthenus]|uniref:receptor activity-modifying protein 2 isoform X1 n=1 Tax=Acipenser ruthenus TaxID=7906 RepID=UPI00145A59CB|nr:receptor activity-modifying protein 2 isoform X1 [Acipenser ruthenus]